MGVLPLTEATGEAEAAVELEAEGATEEEGDCAAVALERSD